ncbi:hypothetical protein SRIMM317S_00397 [Streptomyces rimosus subsp. rimosus]
MPRTSRAVSHCSRSCSGPPGCPRMPACRCAAGQCPAVSFTTVAAAPATTAAAPTPRAGPAPVPYARSVPNAAAAATSVATMGVPSSLRDSRSESGR